MGEFDTVIAELRERLPVVHSDGRREIREEISLEEGSGVQLLEIYGWPDQILELGRHAHQQIHEYFTIFAGGGEVLLARVETPEQIKTVDLPPGEKISIHPGTIHLFRLRGGTVMYCDVREVDSEHLPGTDMIRYPDFGK